MNHRSRLFMSLTIAAVIAAFVAAVQWRAFLPYAWIKGHGLDYGIVIDAGSHGTRAHLYEWSRRMQDPNDAFEKPITIPKEVYEASYPNGISSLAYGKQNVIGSMIIQPLIDDISFHLRTLNVRKEQWPLIPISIKATAGMRDMAPDIRGSTFQSIRAYLQSSPFKFHDSYARTISGEEEGMYGWLATNVSKNTVFSGPGDSVGSLDMGGASAQIVFEPVHTSIMEDSYQITLAEHDVRLYSHSYLGYGWSDASGRTQARMAIEVVLGHLENLKWPTNPTKAFTSSTVGTELIKVINQSGSEKLNLSPRLNKESTTEGTVSEKGTKPRTSPYLGGTPSKTITLEALNPCLPKGYDEFFTLPHVSYPEGRVFLDVDRNYMLQYMTLLGLSPNPPGSTTDPTLPSTSPADSQIRFDPSVPHHPLSDAVATRDGGNRNAFEPFDGFLGHQDLSYRIHWIGSGSFDQCRDRMKALFYGEPCFTHSCSFNGVYQPRLEGSHFSAFGQYSAIIQALQLPLNPSLNTIEERVGAVCSTNYDSLVQDANADRFGTETGKTIHKLCWKTLWCYSFLVDGLRFDKDSEAITFDANDETGSGGWTLGSMIYDCNRFPYAVTQGRFKWPFYAATLSTVLALITIASMHAELSDFKHNRKTYSLSPDMFHTGGKPPTTSSACHDVADGDGLSVQLLQS